MMSHRFDETNTTVARLDAETIGDERVDFRPRLIHAHGIDREYGIAQRGDARSLHRSLEHLRRAVGENGDAPATRLELSQRGARVGKSVEREIGVEQFAAQRAVDRRHAIESVVQRPLGQRPEIGVVAGERQGPGIFELLQPPDFGEAVGVGAGRGAMPRDRGMDVEQGAIGIEHVDTGATHGLISIGLISIAVIAPMLLIDPRHRQQRRDRTAADVVDARIDDTVAHDLEQHRRVELGAVEFAEHHGEVRAFGIPGRGELRPERDGDRRMRAADRHRPGSAGRLFAALGNERAQLP